MKLKTKLVVALIVVAFLSTAIGMFLSIGATKKSFNQYLASYASNNYFQWQQAIGLFYKENNSLEGLQELVPRTSRMMGNRGMHRGFALNEQVLVIDKEGKVVLDTLGIYYGQQADTKLFTEGKPVLVNDKVIGQVVIRVIPPRGVITLEEQFINSVYKGFIMGGLVAVLFAIILGYLFSNNLVKPIKNLTKIVNEYAQGNWTPRVKITSQDEIGKLGTTFNTMADQLDSSIKLREQLVADVSHELRTPITILRGNLESIQAGIKEATPQLILSMTDEVLRLSKLVEELQELSLIENKSLPLNKKKVDLVFLIKRIQEILIEEIEKKGINIETSFVKKSLYLLVDEGKITQVLINLLSNAIRHTPVQGKITIIVDVKEDRSPLCEVKIIDEGPGIPGKELNNIFERFYRLDEARSREKGGMGLGLAITKGIVEAHGGKIGVKPNKPIGTIFAIELPLD